MPNVDFVETCKQQGVYAISLLAPFRRRARRNDDELVLLLLNLAWFEIRKFSSRHFAWARRQDRPDELARRLAERLVLGVGYSGR